MSNTQASSTPDLNTITQEIKMEEPRRVVMDKNTLVPIGVVFSVILALFSAYTWTDSKFKSIEVGMETKFRTLESSIADLTRTSEDRWTATDMVLWEQELRRRNPAQDFPRVVDILNYRVRPR